VRPAIIINPISGSGGRPETARMRAEMAVAALDARGMTGEVFVTERGGHARDLARGAVARGASLVVAWGGDGTMNEVASALVATPVPMALIPSGSGNGLARELGIPRRPSAAWAVVFEGRDRRIDTGLLDDATFVNVAGIGFDARVAHRFAAAGQRRRGLVGYVEAAARELFTRERTTRTVTSADGVLRGRFLMIAVANSRQFGNGVIVAADARLDDGLLDIVAVEDRSVPAVIWQLPRLVAGTLAHAPGVHTRRVDAAAIDGESPTLCHVDGEPRMGGATVTVRVRPASLSVRVPVTR